MENSLFRQGMSMLLEADGDISVVAQFDSADDAAETLRRLPTCIVLLDVDSRHAGYGIADVIACRAASAGCSIVIISGTGVPERVLDLLDAGASGFVLKDSAARVLTDAIKAVSRGEHVIDSRLTGSLLGAVRDLRRRLEILGDHGQSPLLTARQSELMHKVAAGLTNRQIASELGISESTVKNHLHQIFRQLGVTSRSQAISVGVRLGIVRP
jgi:DNA-binding NarL/FixJ family response regulator